MKMTKTPASDLKYVADLVKLEDKTGVDKSVSIKVAPSMAFAEQAPVLVAVMEKATLPIALLNQNPARLSRERIGSSKRAYTFRKEHPEVWQAWGSADAAKKINAAL